MNEKQLETMFKALANRRRIAILIYLKHKGTASVSDTAREINLSLKATFKHLIMLSHVNVVDKQQVSLTVLYTLSRNQHPVIAKLLSLL